MPRKPHFPPQRPAQKVDQTERVVGVSAARAVLEQRPKDVLNLAHTPEARKEVAELLRVAAKLRIAYREVPREELERMAGTLHHEGVCLRVLSRPSVVLDDVLEAMREPGFVLVLDGVENPHNIGALLRSAAYFGARALVVRGGGDKLSSAAVRIAEGGAERVPVCFVDDLTATMAQLKKIGVTVVAADSHGGEPLPSFRFADKTALVLGAEREGLSKAVLAHKPARVHIPGTGHVESLNVSVAAGVLLAAVASRK